MNIEIVAVGSELLTPFFLDTNSLYLTRRLNDLGLDPDWKTVVGDDADNLALALRVAVGRSDLLFVTGGIGPTGDDMTREVLADVLGKSLRLDEAVLDRIRERFRRRGREMPESNRKQAFVIEGAEVLENWNGTAPGQWLADGPKRIVLLPGPPRELEPMCEEDVWPRLATSASGFLIRRTLKTAGMGESDAESLIRDLYPDQKNVRLTLLASPGQVEFHISARSGIGRGEARAAADHLAASLRQRLGNRVFSENGEELEEVVGRLLGAAKKTLSVAESCSGGLIADRITRVPGSSAYFLEAAVTYSNESKIRVLGVPAGLLASMGAVSAEVAEAMASGVRSKSGADYGVSVTGIAGPSGATPEKPLGLVFSALAWDGGVFVERNVFFGGREQVKFQSSQKALDMLRTRLERAAALEEAR
jgi:nicotinamide-nucleotide amidase